MTIDPSNTEYVASFAKGLKLLCSFGAETPRMSVAEAARRTGFNRATARRFLLTLCALGFAREEGRQFELTPAVLRIGYAYLTSLEFWEGIQTRLQGVTETLEESCSAAVLDGDEIVYVARSAAPTRLVSTHLGIGARLPAHATSIGMVLLAGLSQYELEHYFAIATLTRYTENTCGSREELEAKLDQVRQDGYAIGDQEREHGLRSISMPLRDATGRTLAALNVSTHAGRTSLQDMTEQFLPVLREAVADCESALRFRGGAH